MTSGIRSLRDRSAEAAQNGGKRRLSIGVGYNRAVIYRLRIYRAVPEHLDVFHDFFRTRLLPVQLRHGARLIGRWVTEDHRVVAVWEYDSRDAYEAIDAAIRRDPDSLAAQAYRHAELPQLFYEREEVFMADTVG